MSHQLFFVLITWPLPRLRLCARAGWVAFPKRQSPWQLRLITMLSSQWAGWSGWTINAYTYQDYFIPFGDEYLKVTIRLTFEFTSILFDKIFLPLLQVFLLSKIDVNSKIRLMLTFRYSCPYTFYTIPNTIPNQLYCMPAHYGPKHVIWLSTSHSYNLYIPSCILTYM